MTITNKHIGHLYLWLTGKKSQKVELHFINEHYDKNLSQLAFYNQSLIKFDEASKNFIAKIERAKREASN